jgi:ProP effector
MSATNGADPASAATEGEARKVENTGKCYQTFIAPLNATQAPARKRRYEAAIQTLLLLRTRFPQCFLRLDSRSRPPLKIGIHLDIIAAMPELLAADVRNTLRLYTGDAKYLSGCTEGKDRIGLDGQPVGAVTAAEAAHCRDSLAGIVAKRGQRKPHAQPEPALAPPTPKKLSLQDLREAAAKRKLAA